MPYLIPLAHLAKCPRRGESWKGMESSDPADHQRWLEEGLNLAFLPELNEAVVVDIDDKRKAREFYRKWKHLLGPLLETRKGIHAFFAGTTRTRKLVMDDEVSGDLKGNGFTVFAGSTVKDRKTGELWTYRWVPGHPWSEPLPPFPAELFPDTKPELQTVIEPNVDRLRLITKAMVYADLLPPSVSGARGHNAAFRFACKMVRQPPNGFGLAIEEAWPIALMFNSRCEPPWDEASLRRKLIEAKRKDS